MRISAKSLLIGAGAGAAITLIILEVWGRLYLQELNLAATPPVILPFIRGSEEPSHTSSDWLPKPWFPQMSPTALDDWQLESLTGEKLKFSRFRGKVVFLNFWSTG